MNRLLNPEDIEVITSISRRQSNVLPSTSNQEQIPPHPNPQIHLFNINPSNQDHVWKFGNVSPTTTYTSCWNPMSRATMEMKLWGQNKGSEVI